MSKHVGRPENLKIGDCSLVTCTKPLWLLLVIEASVLVAVNFDKTNRQTDR